ncbi:TPA: Bro-N domain-containing protein [Pasteurella multocida]|uniref:BRO-N domain-containing protein n=1 Tax=Pasteurella multocida TaxID=747 RepID=UPI00094ABE38|nr:Bro-N domain-containing protein [Pasteurella multocida]HEH9617166.1 Bro-N domain-containing protein [Pasteurella multocida]HEH9625852.1 Bro-N domain-containing protein [Pasteurella multocida]HEH9637395.1 Bro-N domain-containing protein [Pasteurella multocida]HEH9661057.1 Bro-N domain-containing protein [Pasteurella multocida]HEH9663441.1 Bro-N domain-containing protein [Pasteurella multocida]
MSNLIQFQSFDFHSNSVRVITDPNQEFWFCGVDVCNILGYGNSRATIQKHCKQGGVSKRYTPTQSGEQEMIFINEPNLYRLIIKSRKPEAELFETWVFEEVLPQIRKTGKYEVQSQQLALPEPDLNLTAIQNSEETLALIIQLYSYCFQAHEMQEKLQNTSIAKLMENQIGGQYLYNFKHPLEQVMAKAKKYVHANTERLALVKAVNNLLN